MKFVFPKVVLTRLDSGKTFVRLARTRGPNDKLDPNITELLEFIAAIFRCSVENNCFTRVQRALVAAALIQIAELREEHKGLTLTKGELDFLKGEYSKTQTI
ncbi:hypothetical protein HYT84_02065 [Candidatus Micrarchaeota archaeon]|nr:hypothetical protein [Candidatus Micrarchaeota archaeon]